MGYSQNKHYKEEEQEEERRETVPSFALSENIQEVLKQQSQMILAQQDELAEIKGMLKLVLKQQQQQHTTSSTFPPPPTFNNTSDNRTSNSNMSAEENESVEDIKVHMQLLQKSAASQFSKANKDFSKQCSILFQMN